MTPAPHVTLACRRILLARARRLSFDSENKVGQIRPMVVAICDLPRIDQRFFIRFSAALEIPQYLVLPHHNAIAQFLD